MNCGWSWTSWLTVVPSLSQGRAGEPRLHADERGRYAPLYLAVAEAAQRVGATAIGLIDVGRAAGLNLNLDHVGIAYDHGALLGMSESPVQRAFMPVKHSTVPSTPLPEVVARLAVDRAPLDVTDEDVVGRLCASASSDSADELREELRLAASLPRVLLAGDLVDLLPVAVERVPAGALPVVMTTWSLSRLKPVRRVRFWERLQDAAGTSPLAWVSVEGVGVAPHVPTLGDRPASGHSIIGLGLYDGSAWSVEALGRCWSRGRMIEWGHGPRSVSGTTRTPSGRVYA